jgi:hypothetical protein
VNADDKTNWEVTEDENGDVILHFTLEDGMTEHVKVRGLPELRNGRAEMIYRTAESIVIHERQQRRRLSLRGAVEKAEVKGKEKQTIAPPPLAELVISFLAPKNSVQAQLGDLQEMFQKNADRFGERQARRKYWKQVAVSLAPLIWKWLKRIGFFTFVVDYFRSKLGL